MAAFHSPEFALWAEKVSMTPLSQNSLEDARRQVANCVLFRGLVTGERDAVVARDHFSDGIARWQHDGGPERHGADQHSIA